MNCQSFLIHMFLHALWHQLSYPQFSISCAVNHLVDVPTCPMIMIIMTVHSFLSHMLIIYNHSLEMFQHIQWHWSSHLSSFPSQETNYQVKTHELTHESSYSQASTRGISVTPAVVCHLLKCWFLVVFDIVARVKHSVKSLPNKPSNASVFW